MTTNRFEKLLQDAKKLPNISSKSETPQLNRDIRLIAKESQIMASKVNANQDLTPTGHYFLAQSGANTQEVTSNLKMLDTKFTFEPSQVAKKTDVEAYLNQVYKEYEKQTIERSKKDRIQSFFESMDEGLHSNWQKAKTQILQNWELEQDNKKFGRQTQGKDQSIQKLRKKILAYASVVKDINLNRLLLNKIPVMNKFKALSNLTECTNIQRTFMLEAWDLASHLANEKRESGECMEGVYTSQDYDKASIVQMNRRLINASRTWLEKQYYLLAEDILFKNANIARVGGSPSVSHRLRAFMDISFKTINKSWFNPNLEIYNGIPIWLFIFILLRSGYPDLAIRFIEDNQTSFSSAPEFPLYFKEYFSSPDHRLCEESRKKVSTQFRIMKYGNESVDPVKILLYQILGRCELNSTYPCEVISTIEDYIWLRLTLVRESLNEEQTEHERYHLSDLQQVIAEHDFKKNELNPWLYFKILLLTLQFERATHFLYSNENFKVEAVHFGIGFVYHGLIRIPKQPRDNIIDLLITESDGNMCCLNFVRLINQYIRLFIFKLAEDALQYIYLITLYRTEDMKILCHEQLSNYIIETEDEEYKQLLGQRSVDHQQGTIDKFKPLLGLDINKADEYKEMTLDRIAKGFQDEGRFKDAVNVYELNKNSIAALRVLIRQLDYTLNMGPSERAKHNRQLDEELVEFCIQTVRNYENNASIQEDHKVVQRYHILLKFLQATLKYENKEYEETLEYIKSTFLFPFDGDYTKICQYAERYEDLEDDICSHLPDMIVITIDTLYALWKQYSDRNLTKLLNEEYRKHLIQTYENYSNSIMVFIGLISSKIPSTVLQKINKKVSEIHYNL